MTHIKIEIPEEIKDKYVLCATPKHGHAYNSLLFWGKGDCGYYPNINKCQLYSKEEAMKRASYANCVPIKLTDLTNYFAVNAEHASSILRKSQKKLAELMEVKE